METTEIYYSVWYEFEDETLTGWKTINLYTIKKGKLKELETFEIEADEHERSVIEDYCSKYYDKYKAIWI